jgi:hypothetical protein
VSERRPELRSRHLVPDGRSQPHAQRFPVRRDRSAYLSAGWRWNAWTPYATLARVRAMPAATDPGLPLAVPARGGAARGGGLNGGLNALLASIPQQTSQSLGLRWDLAAEHARSSCSTTASPRATARAAP